ncbi:MAG: polysaccharide biosynthesis protein [Pseudomonadales bacterium RIFCSPLOWO2_12_59_9]|nr:MAG: polysaccharide biosynthesis protein [Pseudomonadales bacterium RIFCSPLOWO2_12_59_9]
MSLRKNSLWNLLGNGAPLLLGFITIPFLLKQSGVEVFGILTMVWGLIGYFSLFDFGLGRALTQTVAQRRLSGSAAELRKVISLGLIMVLVAGVLGGLLLAAVARPLGGSWLNVSEVLQGDVIGALFIAALGIPLTTVTSGLRGVLEAYEDFRDVSILRIILGLANFGMPALTIVFFGVSLEWMVLSLVLSRLIILVAHLMLVLNKTRLHFVYPDAQSEDVKGLLAFGSWMTVSNIVNPLMVTADRFVIASLVGASVVAYYTVPFEVLIRFLIIPGALTAVLFPRLAALMFNERLAAKRLFDRALWIIAAVMFALCSTAALGAFFGLQLWLGREFAENSWYLTVILSVGIFFNSMAQLPYAAAQAAGHVKATAKVHIFELFIYVPMLFLFVIYYGLLGAAVAWVSRVFLDMILMFCLANKAFKASLDA